MKLTWKKIQIPALILVAMIVLFAMFGKVARKTEFFAAAPTSPTKAEITAAIKKTRTINIANNPAANDASATGYVNRQGDEDELYTAYGTNKYLYFTYNGNTFRMQFQAKTVPSSRAATIQYTTDYSTWKNASDALLPVKKDLTITELIVSTSAAPPPAAAKPAASTSVVTGRYVKLALTQAGFMNISQVQVFSTDGKTNIAKGKPVAITGGPYDANPSNAAVNVVDGVGNLLYHSGPSPNLATLIIDLGASVPITRVVVNNRKDCCSGRITGAVLSVLNDAKTAVFTSDAFPNSKALKTYQDDASGFPSYVVSPPSASVVGSALIPVSSAAPAAAAVAAKPVVPVAATAAKPATAPGPVPAPDFSKGGTMNGNVNVNGQFCVSGTCIDAKTLQSLIASVKK